MSERKEVPSTACRFAGGNVEFAQAEQDGRIPITMMARSADPVEHPWWGRVVHDMSGMQLHKKVLPADYEHGDPIGLLNEFDASDKGLIVKGLLVPTGEPRDLVPHLTKQSQGGVPYEASINFFGDGIKVEWLGEDQVAQVNGYTFEGPGCIIREWPLRGVAVCPYGADMYTESKFSGAGAESISIHNFKEPEMKPGTKLSGAAATEGKPADTTSTTTAETKPADEVKPVETPAPVTTETAATPAPAAALSADRQEAKRFKDAFGDAGVIWYFDGLTFDQATAKQREKADTAAKQLSEKVTTLEKENAELKKKLGAAGQFGEAEPIETGATADAKKRAGFASKISIVGSKPAAA